MDLPCAVGYLCFWRPTLHCLLRGQKGTGGLSDGTAEEENSTGLRPHLPAIWNRHVSVWIAPWPWYPCCFLDSVLLNVSQGLRLHAAQRYWNGRRCRWVGSAPTSLAKQMTCLAQVNTFTKYPKLLGRTPSSSQRHILWPSGGMHCGLKKIYRLSLWIGTLSMLQSVASQEDPVARAWEGGGWESAKYYLEKSSWEKRGKH